MNAAEKKIADFLDSVGIKYIYENPMMIEQEFKDRGGTKKFLRIYYPDFFLSEFGVILEFWGMHEQEEYSRVMEKKKQDYYYNWVFVINVYNLEGKWKEYVLNKLKDVSEHRLKRVAIAKEKYDKFTPEQKAGDVEWKKKREALEKDRIARGEAPTPRVQHPRVGGPSRGNRPPQRGGRPPQRGARPPQRGGPAPARGPSQSRRPRGRSRSRGPRPQGPRPAQTAPQTPPAIAAGTSKPVVVESAASAKSPVAIKPAVAKPVEKKPAAKKKVVKKTSRPAEKKTVKKKVVKKAVKKAPKKEGILEKLFKKD